MFKVNVGSADRIVRIIAGVVLLALFFVYQDASWRYWLLIGIVPLAVTTNLNIHFLKKPAAGKDLLAHCRLIKCGRSIAVADVEIFSEGDEHPVAYASASYAIPKG